ncbi:MAG: hypothetical protein AAB592_03235 [Patescibacteria group bacterium]
MATLFIAFGGRKIETKDKIVPNGENIEIWYLCNFKKDELIEELKKRIVFNKVPEKELPAKIEALLAQDAKPTWGILINDASVSDLRCSEMLGLMNLYAQNFLEPLFTIEYVGILTDFGVRDAHFYWGHEGDAQHFRDVHFASFYEQLKPAIEYVGFNADNMTRWLSEKDKEKKCEYFRLFIALGLFNALQRNGRGKDPFLYFQEIVDIATIFETLLTQPDEKTEVTYRLKKRATLLLQGAFPDIEKEISSLYSKRSDFVHGSYFASLAKSIKLSEKYGFPEVPLPEIDLLDLYRKYLRFTLIGYLLLFQKIKSREILEENTVPLLLEKALLDLKLRKKISEYLGEVFSFLKINEYS